MYVDYIKDDVLKNQLILEKIVIYLTKKEDLISARSVCKYWYSIFSPEITLHLSSKENCDLLIKFHFEDFEESEDKKLGILPYKKFNFIKNKDFPNNSWVTTSTFFRRISYLNHHQIKKLFIPPLGMRSLQVLLQDIGHSLEFLQISSNLVDLDNENENDLDRDLYSPEDTELIAKLKMPNIRHIQFGDYIEAARVTQVEKFVHFISQLIQLCGPLLEKLTISYIFSHLVTPILEGIIQSNPQSLKVLEIETPLSERPLLKVIELISLKNKINKIILADFEEPFDTKTLVDYFWVLSLYAPNAFPTLNQQAKNSRNSYNKHLLSRTKMTVTNELITKLKCPLDQFLYHFPKLKKIVLESNYAASVLSNLRKVYKDVEHLSLFNMPGLMQEILTPIVPIAKDVVYSFPNLKVLSIFIINNYEEGFVQIIFENLTKLEDLNLRFNSDLRFPQESEITGVPQLLLNGLKGRSYDILYKFIVKNNSPGISRLKNLKKLTLNMEGLTELSLFFGIRYLPNLEFLALPLINIGDEYLQIFFDGFPKLKNLMVKKMLIEKLKEINGESHILINQ